MIVFLLCIFLFTFYIMTSYSIHNYINYHYYHDQQQQQQQQQLHNVNIPNQHDEIGINGLNNNFNNNNYMIDHEKNIQISNDFNNNDDEINVNLNLIQSFRPHVNENIPTDVKKDIEYISLFNILNKWNPDIPDEPIDFKETLQHFNYGDDNERLIAEKYRNAEIPFKLYNVSDFNEVSRLWSEEYLLKQLYSKLNYHIEKSKDNHFMFWKSNNNKKKNWKPPTTIINNMNFKQWLQLAKDADVKKLTNQTEHYYLMTNEHSSKFIRNDLKLFSTRKNNFFISNVRANKGIQCRFGMRGVIAESHYDSGRNMVAMLKGAKRYIITPPWTCSKLSIIADKAHPSYRHSVIDWSDLEQAKSRGFDKVDAIDTIVRAGEVLYIPTYWFHYIVSLQYSIQCNSRSGFPPKQQGRDYIAACLDW